ncbi:MAG: hypothetical protein ACRDSJ_10520 [Rubrobacteraceae bacterium]
MARQGFADPDFGWFFDLMVDESVWREEEVADEDVESLLGQLLDEAGQVFQVYVEDDPADTYERTERACARVASRAFGVALRAREERR